MKKILIALTIILAFAQCYRFRDNAHLIMLNDEEYTYGSVQEAIEQVRLAYAQIRSLRAYQRNFYIYGDIMSDDTEGGGASNCGDRSGYQFYNRYDISSNNNYVENFYTSQYRAIYNTNEIISQTIIDEGSDDNPMFTNEDKVQFRAEAKFLRAFLYFDLVRVFGPVPFYNEYNYRDTSSVSNRTILGDDAEGNLQKEMVYDYIVNDLEQSMEVLQASEYTFASPFAAKALMVKVLMYRNKTGDNTRALQLAQELIGDGSAILDIKYPDIFCEYFEHSIEGIIELEFENTTCYDIACIDEEGNGLIGTIRMIDQSAKYIYTQNDSGEWEPTTNTYINYGLNIPTQNLVSQFEVNQETQDYDPRLQMITKEANTLYEGQEIDSIYLDDIPLGNNSATNFYPIYSANASTGHYHRKAEPRKHSDLWLNEQAGGLNNILYRYADLVLLAAEAAFNEGDRELAASYINVVRERARNSKIVDVERDENGDFTGYYIYGQSEYPTNTNAAEITMDEIRLERRRELFCESQRFFDLVRWGIQDEVLGALTEDGCGVAINWQPHNKVLPFPISVVEELDGMITQNPGY